jgi:hypothetical protein
LVYFFPSPLQFHISLKRDIIVLGNYFKPKRSPSKLCFLFL